MPPQPQTLLCYCAWMRSDPIASTSWLAIIHWLKLRNVFWSQHAVLTEPEVICFLHHFRQLWGVDNIYIILLTLTVYTVCCCFDLVTLSTFPTGLFQYFKIRLAGWSIGGPLKWTSELVFKKCLDTIVSLCSKVSTKVVKLVCQSGHRAVHILLVTLQ